MLMVQEIKSSKIDSRILREQFFMKIRHLAKEPNVDSSAFIAPNALVCGDVSIGKMPDRLQAHNDDEIIECC